MGYLYYRALGIKAPNTAVPIPPNKVGPFSNFQPNVYWSDSPGGNPNSLTCTIANFSFASGAQGGGCGGDFGDVLPMIVGDPFATQTPGTGPLYVNPGETSVYDPETNSTWVADANLAKRETFGLPRCKTAPDTTPCVAHDGSMNLESAKAWIDAMNAYLDPMTNIVGYLGQTDWGFPPLRADCPTYGCKGDSNPMGNLYSVQLKIPEGEPVVAVPDIAVGPFYHLLPLPYWSCLADTIQEPRNTADNESSANSVIRGDAVTEAANSAQVSAGQRQLPFLSINGECYETSLRNRNSFRRAHRCRLGPALSPECCSRPRATVFDPGRQDRL